MDSLWAALLPLVFGSALVPAQLVVTIALLESASGTRAASAFVGGMTVVRLVQGAVFGLAISSSPAGDDAATASTLKSALLLVVSILLLVMAVKKLATDEDPDAPPPAWLTRTASMPPRQAFLVGAGLLVIAPKFWVFTLSAIAAIEEAAVAGVAAVTVYLVFVVLTALPLLTLIAIATASPTRSDLVLARASAWLTRHNRTVVVGVGLIFGTWFLAQALSGLGVGSR
jgi:threonine/homoserine/homoserine lactone efflux protein